MAARRRDGSGDKRFAELVSGVKPLPRTKRVGRPAPRAAPSVAAAAPPVAFEIERRAERVAGLAKGVDRRHLRRLERGQVEVEAEIDLHGLDAKAARRAVTARLLSAQREGVRCVLVIHGRGKRSEDGPVHKPALVGWLTEPPLDRAVMAFASAPAAQGGPGASTVLLRRLRE